MQGDAAEHERGLVEFVSKARRSRFSESLSKGGKARAKETARLHDRPDLDERWMRPPFAQAAGPEYLAQIVQAVLAHAPNARQAYLVSGDETFDGRFMELAEAVEAVTWTDEGSLLSIIPGHVALYMGELVDSARLLIRKTTR